MEEELNANIWGVIDAKKTMTASEYVRGTDMKILLLYAYQILGCLVLNNREYLCAVASSMIHSLLRVRPGDQDLKISILILRISIN
jgi:hypothetical protein